MPDQVIELHKQSVRRFCPTWFGMGGEDFGSERCSRASLAGRRIIVLQHCCVIENARKAHLICRPLQRHRLARLNLHDAAVGRNGLIEILLPSRDEAKVRQRGGMTCGRIGPVGWIALARVEGE